MEVNEVKELNAKRDYWYAMPMFCGGDNNVNCENGMESYSRYPYEPYDRPIGVHSSFCSEDSSMREYEHSISHFGDY